MSSWRSSVTGLLVLSSLCQKKGMLGVGGLCVGTFVQ
jgi:hypothetical protein